MYKRQFLIIIFIAVTGTIAQTLLNSAFKRGSLTILLPLDFLKLVWAVLIGYTVFIESTPFTLWLGGLLIVGSIRRSLFSISTFGFFNK